MLKDLKNKVPELESSHFGVIQFLTRAGVLPQKNAVEVRTMYPFNQKSQSLLAHMTYMEAEKNMTRTGPVRRQNPFASLEKMGEEGFQGRAADVLTVPRDPPRAL